MTLVERLKDRFVRVTEHLYCRPATICIPKYRIFVHPRDIITTRRGYLCTTNIKSRTNAQAAGFFLHQYAYPTIPVIRVFNY